MKSWHRSCANYLDFPLLSWTKLWHLDLLGTTSEPRRRSLRPPARYRRVSEKTDATHTLLSPSPRPRTQVPPANGPKLARMSRPYLTPPYHWQIH